MLRVSANKGLNDVHETAGARWKSKEPFGRLELRSDHKHRPHIANWATCRKDSFDPQSACPCACAMKGDRIMEKGRNGSSLQNVPAGLGACSVQRADLRGLREDPVGCGQFAQSAFFRTLKGF